MRTELCRQRKPFRQRVQLTFWNMKLCWAQQIYRDLWKPSWTQACLLWHYSDVLFPFNGFHQSRSKGSSIVTYMLRAFSRTCLSWSRVGTLIETENADQDQHTPAQLTKRQRSWCTVGDSEKEIIKLVLVPWSPSTTHRITLPLLTWPWWTR